MSRWTTSTRCAHGSEEPIRAPFVIEGMTALTNLVHRVFDPVAAPPKVGIWAVLHEIRSDWAQLLCCVFLAIVGAGALSLDARRERGSGNVAQAPG